MPIPSGKGTRHTREIARDRDQTFRSAFSLPRQPTGSSDRASRSWDSRRDFTTRVERQRRSYRQNDRERRNSQFGWMFSPRQEVHAEEACARLVEIWGRLKRSIPWGFTRDYVVG